MRAVWMGRRGFSTLRRAQGERAGAAMTDQPLSDAIESAVAGIRDDLEAANRAREQALPLCRSAIRDAANCIRAVHRGELQRAEELLGRPPEIVAKEHTIPGLVQALVERYTV